MFPFEFDKKYQVDNNVILRCLQVRGTDYHTPDGTCIRDYIDVTDLIDAHVKALAHAAPGKVGIYNVGTGKGSFWVVLNIVRDYYLGDRFLLFHSNLNLVACIPITGSSVKEFVEACKKATGVDIKVEYLSRRPGDYAEVYSDPSKINRDLGWSARYNLQESLSIAWKWQKEHRNGYSN